MKSYLARYGTPSCIIGIAAAGFIFLLGMIFLVEKNDVTGFLIGVAGVIMVFFVIPMGMMLLMEIKGIGFLISVAGIPRYCLFCWACFSVLI